MDVDFPAPVADPGAGRASVDLAAREVPTALIAEAQLGLAMLDTDGVVIHANGVLMDLLGIPDGDLTGLPFDTIDVSAPIPDTAEVMREHILTGPDGVEHRVRITGVRWGPDMPTDIARLIAVEDVSTRHKVQSEIQTSQRLEAMGRLASGVAHEINTPIQFVGDNVTFLKEAVDSLLGVIDVLVGDLRDTTQNTSRVERVARVEALLLEADLDFYRQESPLAADQAHDGVMRIATIVRAMKALGHPDKGEMAPAELNQCLRDTVTVTRGSIKQVAEVELELGELPPVVCLPGSVSQVIMNLVVNAADAIRSNRGDSLPGRIRISSAVDGDDALIMVADDGGGIPAEIQDRVFEPFFTTKEVGQGTGQGLALARTVVCDVHAGSLSFVTTPGEGTVFTISLPIAGPVLGRGPAEA